MGRIVQMPTVTQRDQTVHMVPSHTSMPALIQPGDITSESTVAAPCPHSSAAVSRYRRHPSAAWGLPNANSNRVLTDACLALPEGRLVGAGTSRSGRRPPLVFVALSLLAVTLGLSCKPGNTRMRAAKPSARPPNKVLNPKSLTPMQQRCWDKTMAHYTEHMTSEGLSSRDKWFCRVADRKSVV